MGTNDDLLGTLESENFANDDALGTVAVTATKVTAAAGPAVFAISYNASSQSYTVTQGALSQTFSSSDVDPTQSDGTQTTYKRVNGTTTEFLTLVKNGTGPGQTRYVGAGLWQRVTEGTSSSDARFNAFTYGVQTPDPSMPKTGAASFDVMLLGVRNWQTFAYAMGGSGRLSIDFSNGAIAGQGFYNEVDLSSGAGGNQGFYWKSYAMLTADTNNFTGKIDLNGTQGGLQGSFYGPAADEVGAVWWTGLPDEDAGSVGTIYGKRGTYPINQVTQVGSPEKDVFFTTTSTSVKAAMNDAGVLSGASSNSAVKAVFLPGAGGHPVFYRSGSDIPQPVPGVGELSYQLYTYPGEYYRSGMMLDKRNGQAVLDSFIYGFNTESADMPHTGKAYYYTQLEGGLLANGQQLQSLQGEGKLIADFGTGSITADGQYVVFVGDPATGLAGSSPGDTTDSGTYSGTAQISSSSFSGTLSFDGTKDYTGTMDGQFYGPHSEEVGAVFQASGSGAQVSGYLTGGRDDYVSGGFRSFADLTGPTLMASDETWLAYRRLVSEGTAGFPSSQGGLPYSYKDWDLYFDPTSTTARISIVPRGSGPEVDGELARVGDAQRSTALSTDAANVYTFSNSSSGDPTDYRLVEQIFDGQGGRVQLTYTGFTSLYTTTHDSGEALMGPVETAYFRPFGIATPYALRPTTGSASYSGQVFGRGGIYNFISSRAVYYDLGGTNAMSVNFGDGQFTSSLHLTGKGVDDSSLTQDFGTYAFSGTLGVYNSTQPYQEDFGFYGTDSAADYDGKMLGNFFGPAAQEYGGVFDLTISGANGIDGFARGGFVGKKD